MTLTYRGSLGCFRVEDPGEGPECEVAFARTSCHGELTSNTALTSSPIPLSEFHNIICSACILVVFLCHTPSSTAQELLLTGRGVSMWCWGQNLDWP